MILTGTIDFKFTKLEMVLVGYIYIYISSTHTLGTFQHRHFFSLKCKYFPMTIWKFFNSTVFTKIFFFINQILYPVYRPHYFVAHYTDVIMTTMVSQITSLTVVYSTVYSDADQRKHQSSASLAFVWGIHRDR